MSKVIHWPWSKSLRFNILKLLFLNNQQASWNQISCVASWGKGNESLFQWSRSQHQDGRHAHICYKPLKIFFSGILKPMTLKLGMQHWIHKYYQICSNDAPGFTLTYFTARSNLVPYAFVWGKVSTMDFTETIVVYDIKVVRCSELMSTWSLMITKGQGHFLTLFQIIYIQYF